MENHEMQNEMENEMNNEMENEVWVAWLDGKKDEAVEFVVPLIGCDVAQAGADALGIDVCEQLNVSRKID